MNWAESPARVSHLGKSRGSNDDRRHVFFNRRNSRLVRALPFVRFSGKNGPPELLLHCTDELVCIAAHILYRRRNPPFCDRSVADDIGLEIGNAPLIPTNLEFEEIEDSRTRSFHGKVTRVDVIVPKALLLESEKAELLLRSFKAYKFEEWQEIDIGKFVCFTQEVSQIP
jgi:hypothetical protein